MTLTGIAYPEMARRRRKTSLQAAHVKPIDIPAKQSEVALLRLDRNNHGGREGKREKHRARANIGPGIDNERASAGVMPGIDELLDLAAAPQSLNRVFLILENLGKCRLIGCSRPIIKLSWTIRAVDGGHFIRFGIHRQMLPSMAFRR
jgi:hypothetical protein